MLKRKKEEVIAQTIRHVPRKRKKAGVVRDSGYIDNVDIIRNRARQDVCDGAVTESYAADRNAVINLLNDALATELVCVLRYRRHYFTATGLHAQTVAAEFLEHANEELAHADALAARIAQLGGEPDFSPKHLSTRSHAEYRPGESLEDMMREDLIAERIAIDTYRQIIRFIGDDDPTTRRMLEEILASEEHHADELANMLETNLGEQ